ncbi:MAG: MFS transporter, partial [Verrucomicrobiae bacterium]|nr:MFS transporter [Verrucomicrobiae bacterium]
MGAAAFWLGLTEGISDGLSSFAKLGSGYYTDRLRHRKPVAVLGYVVTALGTAAIGLATSAWHVLFARAAAWLGRGIRTPVRKALLAAAVTPETYGRAFGFERMMDTLGAIAGPALAVCMLALVEHNHRILFGLTLIPGFAAAASMAFLVKERQREPVGYFSFLQGLRGLPGRFKSFLLAVGVFGAGDFAHSMLILLATDRLSGSLGPGKAASIAVGLYVIHNVLYEAAAFGSGILAYRFSRKQLLAG